MKARITRMKDKINQNKETLKNEQMEFEKPAKELAKNSEENVIFLLM